MKPSPRIIGPSCWTMWRGVMARTPMRGWSIRAFNAVSKAISFVMTNP